MTDTDPGCLLFDLDGTLTDPLPGMAASINHALKLCGYPQVPVESLAQYVGPPLEGTFRALVPGVDESTENMLIEHYRDRYRALGYRENSIYPGIEALLGRLKISGQRLGVCTAKPESIARQVLEHFALTKFFGFVSGGGIGIRKDQQLEQLLQAGTIDQTAVMIGDRNVDMIAAKSNGLTGCGVLWGYGGAEELAAGGATLTVESPDQLLRLVKRLRTDAVS